MRKRIRRIVPLLLAVSVVGSVSAEPQFRRAPAAIQKGRAVRIEFTVSEATDVAVYVEDATGKVVRHLAAGRLGPNAPAPLKADSLAQSIVWDGKDDAGKAAGQGPFRVRVGLGLTAANAGTAFGEHQGANTLTSVIGLAAGPDGRVYVLSQRWKRAWWRSTHMHVFRRDGSYEKTIKPFPANMPAERVKAVTPLTHPDGSPLPVVYRVLTMGYYPKEDAGQQFVVTPDGRVHFVVIPAAYRKGPQTWLATLDGDGGVPLETYTGGVLYEKTSPGDVNLALSSDGKSVFATGLGRGHRGEQRPNIPAVFKIALATRGPAKVFFGDEEKVGKGESHLDEPRGLATDGRGHLLVADSFNNRVVEINEADGRFVCALAVPRPLWVGFDRRNARLYVHSGNGVVCFRRAADGTYAQVARLDLPRLNTRYQSRVQWRFALDTTGEGCVLWMGRNYGEPALLLCRISGDEFGEVKAAGAEPARTFWNLASTLDRRKVACKVGNSTLRILDEDTGKTRDLRLTGSAGQTYRFGPNDQIYGIDHWRWGVRRWDADGKPLPFADSAKDPEFKGRLWNRPSGTTSWERDFDVDRAGNVYVKHRGKTYHGRMAVDKYDADGKLVGRILWVVSDGAQGPRVDPAGNVYIAENLKPHGVPYPQYFIGKLPAVKIDKKGSVKHQYRWMYGSIAKFSPAGGAVWYPKLDDRDVYPFDGEAKLDALLKKEPVSIIYGDHVKMLDAQLQGALWLHLGVSYILDMHPGHNRRCHCTATEFEVDDFGRVWYTDQGRFRVVVLDTNGNEVTAFGQYGNQDATGPGIHFNWFTGLGVTDRYCYAADGNNRRVVRVKLGYAAEQTCPVR